MKFAPVAQHLAAQGRGNDSMLIHMTPGEVHGLQALAMAHGGSLTVNPSTGLPEASFLEKILPTVIGAGLTLTGVGMPLAVAGGALAGAATNKDPLTGALMGGLGAYGGAGLTEGLVGAAGAAPSALAEGTVGANAAMAGEGAKQLATNPQSWADFLGHGAAKGVEASGLGGYGGALKTGMALMAPHMADAEQNERRPGQGPAPKYRYSARYTGGTRGEGAAETSEANYFEAPYYTRMAGGGLIGQDDEDAPNAADSLPGAWTMPGGDAGGGWSYDAYVPGTGSTGADVGLGLGSLTPPTPIDVPNGSPAGTSNGGNNGASSGSGSGTGFGPGAGGGGGSTPPINVRPPATDGGLGATAPAPAPAPYSYERDPVTGMGGESLRAYRYLMGEIGSARPAAPVAAPAPAPAQTPSAMNVTGRAQYSFNPLTGAYTRLNPGSEAQLQQAAQNALGVNPGEEGTVGGAKPAAGTKKSGFAEGGALEEGAFIVPADVVSMLGNGSSSAGLEFLMERFGAHPIDGPGDGMSDSIPTSIAGRQPAAVARDEAYIPAAIVEQLGGAEALYAFMERVRRAAHGKPTQQRKIDPNEVA